MTIHYVPHITSLAGTCLSRDNWRELGIHTGLARLSHLLIKPGLEFWQQTGDLKRYLAWDGIVILDCDLKLNHADEFIIQSPYDGSRVTLSLDQFWDVIKQLQPDGIVIAQDLAQRSPIALPNELLILPTLARLSAQDSPIQPVKLEGRLLQNKETELWYATDQPAQLALDGMVFGLEPRLAIQDPMFATDFQIVQADCACPTCQQGFTRAYLHYLFESTPLLCQRFLMMHNVYWFSKFLASC
jgi:queuine tRNA-ribosyltransferase